MYPMEMEPAAAEALGSTRHVLDELRALVTLTSKAGQEHDEVSDGEAQESRHLEGVEARASPTGSPVLHSAGEQADRRIVETPECQPFSEVGVDALRLADAIMGSVRESR